MKKIILLLILAGITGSAFAQGGWTNPNPGAYGARAHRLSADSTLFFPTGCGAPVLHGYNLKMSAVYYDSCAGVTYIFNPAGAGTWTALSSGSPSPWVHSGTKTILVNPGDSVGIGTSTPGYKLEINGYAKASRFYINDGTDNGEVGTAGGSAIDYNDGTGDFLYANHVFGGHGRNFWINNAKTATTADSIWAAVGDTLTKIPFSGGGGALTNGSGTIANGTAVDLGGEITSDMIISGESYNASFYMHNRGASFRLIDGFGQSYLGDYSAYNDGSLLSIKSLDGTAVLSNTATDIKVGINNGSPTVALDVVGNVHNTSELNLGSEINASVQTSASTGITQIGDTYQRTNGVIFAVDAPNALAYLYAPTGTPTPTTLFGVNTNTPTEALDVNGGVNISGKVKLNRTYVAADYTVSDNDYVITVDNGASSVTITLPDASTCLNRIIIIKRYDATSIGTITINTAGGQVQDETTGTFNSTTALTLWGNQGQSVTFQSNATDFEAIN